MGNVLDIVDLKSNLFAEAVYEHGWACTRISEAVGRNKQYLRQAMANSRINYQTLLEMCKVLDVDPEQFIGLEDCTPLEIPTGPIRLSNEGTVTLFTAIVTRAKEDYILAYRDKLCGKHGAKTRDGHVTLWVDTIERELTAEWFRHHLIGAVTTNARAVETMIGLWRKEAERSLAR